MLYCFNMIFLEINYPVFKTCWGYYCEHPHLQSFHSSLAGQKGLRKACNTRHFPRLKIVTLLKELPYQKCKQPPREPQNLVLVTRNSNKKGKFGQGKTRHRAIKTAVVIMHCFISCLCRNINFETVTTACKWMQGYSV